MMVGMTMAFPLGILAFPLYILAVLIAVRLIIRAVRRTEEPETSPSGEKSEQYFNERRRILDMVQAGQVSGDEAERLLVALDQGYTRRAVFCRAGPRTQVVSWPKLIIGALLLWVLIMAALRAVYLVDTRLLGTPAGLHQDTVSAPTAFPPLGTYFPTVLRMLPKYALTGLPMAGLQLALFVFWVWMLINCLRRPAEDFEFAVTITPQGRYDKIVWIAALVLLTYIAAIAYFFMVYRRRGVRAFPA